MKWSLKLLVALLAAALLAQFVAIIYLTAAFRMAETRENALVEQIFLNQEIKQHVTHLYEIHQRASEICQHTLHRTIQHLGLTGERHQLVYEHVELRNSIGGP